MKKLYSISYSGGAFNVATLLLRLCFGGTMLTHGLQKLQNLQGTIDSFNQNGGGPFGLSASVAVYLLIFAEFFCAIFVMMGLFTRLALIPLIIAMAVAFFSAHKMIIDEHGYPSLSYLIVFLVLMLTGPGRFSVDGLMSNKR